MGRRPATFIQSDVERVINAARNAGLRVDAVEVSKSGTIRILTNILHGKTTANSDFDKWEEGRDAR